MNLEIKKPKHNQSKRRFSNNHHAPVLTISLGHSNGNWCLSQELRRIAGLDAGHKVNIAQDKDTGIWYVGFSKTGEGQTLRFTGGKYSLVFRNKEAAKEILDELVYAAFLVMPNPTVEDGVTWYKVMTSNPLYSEKGDDDAS